MTTKNLHAHSCDELEKGEEVLYDPISKTWAPYFHGQEQNVSSNYCHKCGEQLPKGLKKFHVRVPELWWQTYEVIAEDRNHAINKASGTDSDREPKGDLDYSHRLERDKWEAEEIP